MTNPTTAEIISLMSMLVALVALVVGPIVTLRVAKRQIVSPIRQKWIDELRQLMSEYLSECQGAIVFDEGKGLLNVDNADKEIFLRLLFLEHKLGLMLNPQETDHVQLTSTIHDITEEVQHGVDNFSKFGEKVGSATRMCQKILKIEWTRVKSGAM